MYRLKKSVRRHRALFASAVTLLVVLTVGVVVSTIFAVGQARALSENQLIVDYLFMGVLQPLGRQSDRQLSVQDILDMATENLEGRFGKYPSTEAEIREWLGSIYVWGLDDYYAGADQLERSRNLAEKSGEQYGGSDALGWAYFRQGRYEEAAQQLEQVVGRRRQLSVPKPGGYFPWTHLASVYVAQGRYNEAEEVILETWKRHFPDNQDELSPNLGEIYLLQGRYEEAEAIYRKGIEDNRTDRFSWGFWYHRCGLAQLCTEQGRYEEANVLLTEVLDKARETHGAQQLWKLHCVNCLAVLRREQGQHGEAETLFLKALEGRRKLGEDHPDTLETLHELALLYKKQELYDRSAPLLEKAVKGRRLKLGDTHPHTLESVNHLIELYEAWGRPDQANKWRIKFP